MRHVRGRTAAAACIVLVLSVADAPMLPAQEAPLNRVVARIQADRPAIGTFSRSPDAALDFTVVDAQYGDLDLNAIRRTLDQLRTGDGPPTVSPIVRIPVAAAPAPETVVGQLLNVGAFGIMFPNIETPEQAVTAVGAMRYNAPRLTGRGRLATPGHRQTGSGSAPDYWGLTDDGYRAVADVWPLNPSGQLLAVLQIESLSGIERIDEILDIPGIGAIFLGPTDLAASIGADGPNAPEVEALVQDVLGTCLARSIPCGYPIVAATQDQANQETARRLREGFTMLAVMTTAE